MVRAVEVGDHRITCRVAGPLVERTGNAIVANLASEFLAVRAASEANVLPITVGHHPLVADARGVRCLETAEWLADLPASKGAKVHFIQGHESRLEYVDYDRAAALHRAPFHKIVVSQWLRDAMIDEFGARDCVLVGNAVDADQFDFVPRDKKHTPTVGFVYSPVVSKNPALAFAACADLRQKFPALRVVSFGSHKPGHTETFPDWIEFHHRPAQQKIAEIYAACDVWLFTRDYEGFGLPILEAMACGTPVVATRAGAAPELVDATVGALVNSTSEAIVGAATKILKADNTAWRKLSANARARAAAYGWDDAGALFERALRNFAAKTPRDIK